MGFFSDLGRDLVRHIAQRALEVALFVGGALTGGALIWSGTLAAFAVLPLSVALFFGLGYAKIRRARLAAIAILAGGAGVLSLGLGLFEQTLVYAMFVAFISTVGIFALVAGLLGTLGDIFDDLCTGWEKTSPSERAQEPR